MENTTLSCIGCKIEPYKRPDGRWGWEVTDIFEECFDEYATVYPPTFADTEEELFPWRIKKYIISHPINGISLNGDEYVLEENGEYLKFDSEDAAIDFLVEHDVNHDREAVLEDLDNGALAIRELGDDGEPIYD